MKEGKGTCHKTPRPSLVPPPASPPTACCKAAHAEEAAARGCAAPPLEAPQAAAAAAASRHGSTSVAAPALLASYQPERQWHLAGVTLVALVIGRLVMLSSPAPLRIARNWVVGALYHCPLTRPFFKVRREVVGGRGGGGGSPEPPPHSICPPQDPFAPPTSLGRGLFDFHAPDGRRRWQRTSSTTTGRRRGPPPGWRGRDDVTGRLMPNAPVGSASRGPASRQRLDAALEEAIARFLGAGGAPAWVLLCAPHTSAAPWPADGGADGGGEAGEEEEEAHPLRRLSPAVRAWMAATAARTGPAAYAPLVVLQAR